MTPAGGGEGDWSEYCSLLMRKETAKKRLGARRFNAFSREKGGRVAAHSSRDFASTDACPAQTFFDEPRRVSARTEPRLASPEYSLLSTHTHIHVHVHRYVLCLFFFFFFLSISISTRTQLEEEEEEGRAHAHACTRSERRAHARGVRLDEARGRESGGWRRAAARNISTFHRPTTIQKCRREFCIMHGPRSAELPA